MYNGIFKFYEIGGCVRDEIIGVKSKDIDYVAVPNLHKITHLADMNQVFDLLVLDIKMRGYEIFLITPRAYTIRAKMPAGAITADFVLARKEIGYEEGTRNPIVIPGSLREDQERRDFTMNSIAKDCLTGEYIDPFNGIQDIHDKVLRTPIDGAVTFDDDPLRLLRALRFAVTKGFIMDDKIIRFLVTFDYEKKFHVVSEERIREELYKCFKYSTLETMKLLNIFFHLRDYVFKKTNLWLKPTNEKQ